MTTALPKQNIFTEIKDPLEKEKLYQELAYLKVEMIAKAVEDGAATFKIKAYDYRSDLLSALLKTEGFEVPASSNLILQFQLGSDKYITQVSHRTSKDMLSLQMSSPLFRIQRRQDFRIRIPSSINARLRLKNPADKKMILVEVIDLSGGGCRLIYPTKEIQFNVQQKFTASLEIDGREPFIFNCMVQHQNPDPEKKDYQQAGIQFINLNEKDKNKIVSLVLDLYKEYMKK